MSRIKGSYEEKKKKKDHLEPTTALRYRSANFWKRVV